MRHFKQLKDLTGIEYQDMLFFDDEKRNAEVQSLGVTFVLVGTNGVTERAFYEGIDMWRTRRNHTLGINEN
jgi:magnesium-dependent phosphatase 1